MTKSKTKIPKQKQQTISKGLAFLKKVGLDKAYLRKVKEILEREDFTEKQIDFFIKEIYTHYKRALIVPREPIGTVAAQSIGEPGTQMTLRTFHYAGVSEFSVTRGLPRLIELVDARRNPATPTMTIYLDKNHRHDLEKAKEVLSQIEQISIDKISEDVEPDMEEYAIYIYLIKELMTDKNLTIDDVLESLKKYSKNGKVSIEDEDDENILIRIGLDTQDIQKIQKQREKIKRTLIRGIKGIERGILKKEEKDDGSFEWMIITEGTNLVEVLRIPGVDRNRTYSNHIHEIEKVFGVEAARRIIIKEAIDVLEDQSLDVDIRHLYILADLMTLNGSIQQIGRHGISGKKKSVFARAAFEVTIKQLMNAAVRGEEEHLLGVPENVIVGQIVPTIGTGSIILEMDFAQTQRLLQSRRNK